MLFIFFFRHEIPEVLTDVCIVHIYITNLNLSKWSGYIIYMYIGHTLRPMSIESRFSQTFGHNVCHLVVGVGVSEVHDSLLTPVSYNVMLDIDVFGALRGGVVGGHLNTSFIVFTEDNWLLQFDA